MSTINTTFRATPDQLLINATRIHQSFENKWTLLNAGNTTVAAVQNSPKVSTLRGLQQDASSYAKDPTIPLETLNAIQEKLCKASSILTNIENFKPAITSAQIFADNVPTPLNTTPITQSSLNVEQSQAIEKNPITQSSLNVEQSQAIKKDPILEKTTSLQYISSLLESENQSTLYSVMDLLKDLESSTVILEQLPMNGADRVFLHLYNIHKCENLLPPEPDYNYGRNAMAGQYRNTTNEHRRRAVQRAIVELAIYGLKQVDHGQKDTIKALHEILEKEQMDARDLPIDQKNVAYALFGYMYQVHCKLRQENSILIDPNHSLFKSDFGRNAFFHLNLEGGQMHPNLKSLVCSELLNELRSAWKQQV